MDNSNKSFSDNFLAYNLIENNLENLESNSICEYVNDEVSIQFAQFFNKNKGLCHEEELNKEINLSEKNSCNFESYEEQSQIAIKDDIFLKQSKLNSFDSNIHIEPINNFNIFKENNLSLDENKEKEIENIEIKLNSNDSINSNKIKVNNSFKENNNDNNKKNKKKNLFNLNKLQNKFIIKKVFNSFFYPTQIRKEINNIITPKFKIFKDKKEKKEKKEKKSLNEPRRQKSDNIRKKIKSRFLKALKFRINENLKNSNSELLFDYLPQCFIKEITKNRNKSAINKTYKELLSTNFLEEYHKEELMLKKKRHKEPIEDENITENVDYLKYKKNKEVLEYLKKNSEICKKSKFDIIGNMTFEELYKEYLESKEFEDEISNLKESLRYNKEKNIFESENSDYIKEYIIKAYDFINFFTKSKSE